jgi:hypothetical protein
MERAQFSWYAPLGAMYCWPPLLQPSGFRHFPVLPGALELEAYSVPD